MSGETTGEQDVPERPARETSEDGDGGGDADGRDDRRRIGSVSAEPGARRTSSVELLVIEAELVADGHRPDNPAIPIPDSGAAPAFFERTEETELVPAWTRPWEQDGGDE